MNVKELRQAAKDLGITGYSSLKKAELEQAIQAAKTAEDEDARPMNRWAAAVESGLTVTELIDQLDEIPDSPEGLPTLRSRKVKSIIEAYESGATVKAVDEQFRSYFGDPDILAGAYFALNNGS